MPKPEKINAVADIKKLFDESNSFFITDYQGLNVADMTDLRKNLRSNNVKYLIAKNTLFKIAAGQAGVSGVDEHLNGPTALAFTSDEPAVAAKILNDSFKDKDLPVMKAFYLEEILYPGSDIKRLADLPSREMLLSQLVASVEAPFSELVGSLDGFFRELVGSIDALQEKRETEG
ncbi:MAG: 50S ribosomal protein L10 [candidate division Zixibacteria bacterium]|nr:50S ribosomal protein L10 [candidate division Zixibacteria bacterium]